MSDESKLVGLNDTGTTWGPQQSDPVADIIAAQKLIASERMPSPSVQMASEILMLKRVWAASCAEARVLRARIKRAIRASANDSASDAVQLMIAELEGDQQPEGDE